MSARQRNFLFITMLLSLWLSSASLVQAKDKEFKAVVKHLEKNYKARKTKIRFLGLANFAVKLIRPAGVKGFKVAMYENQDFAPRENERPFSAVMREAYVKGWQPLLQTTSKRDGGARTFIYIREEKKDIKIAVVALQEREAFVAEVKLNPDAAAKFLEKPQLLGKSLGGLRNDSIIASADPNRASRKREESKYTADLSVLNASAETPAASTVTATNDSTQPATPSLAEQTTTKPVLRTAFTEEAKASTTKEEAEEKPATASATSAKTSDPDAVKVETRLVNLNVKAINASGQFIGNLSKEDFTIYEDGVKQEVAYFAPVNAPISLVMLLDLSGSTEKKIKDMKAAAKNFVDSLNPDTRIAVGVFASRFKLITPFVADRLELKTAIDTIKHRGGGTEYYRAMGTALDLLKESNQADGGNRRQVIVVLTDGVDNSLQRGSDADLPEFDEMLARVSEEDVTIYPIYFDTENKLGKIGWMFSGGNGSNSVTRYRVARKQLEEVAEQTGGMLFTATRAEDLTGVYNQVAAELQQLYSLAYLPEQTSQKPGFRKIAVKVNRDGAVAKTRRGYHDK